jgi:hypothetical protein
MSAAVVLDQADQFFIIRHRNAFLKLFPVQFGQIVDVHIEDQIRLAFAAAVDRQASFILAQNVFDRALRRDRLRSNSLLDRKFLGGLTSRAGKYCQYHRAKRYDDHPHDAPQKGILHASYPDYCVIGRPMLVLPLFNSIFHLLGTGEHLFKFIHTKNPHYDII